MGGTRLVLCRPTEASALQELKAKAAGVEAQGQLQGRRLALAFAVTPCLLFILALWTGWPDGPALKMGGFLLLGVGAIAIITPIWMGVAWIGASILGCGTLNTRGTMALCLTSAVCATATLAAIAAVRSGAGPATLLLFPPLAALAQAGGLAALFPRAQSAGGD